MPAELIILGVLAVMAASLWIPYIVGVNTAPAGSICTAVFNLFDCWIDEELFDSRFDLAIRSWAQTDDALMARVKAADSARLGAMRAMLERHGQSPAMAATRANTMIFTQVGYYTMRLGESVSDRLERMPPYVQVFTGEAPSEAETAEFFARHGARRQGALVP